MSNIKMIQIRRESKKIKKFSPVHMKSSRWNFYWCKMILTVPRTSQTFPVPLTCWHLSFQEVNRPKSKATLLPLCTCKIQWGHTMEAATFWPGLLNCPCLKRKCRPKAERHLSGSLLVLACPSKPKRVTLCCPDGEYIYTYRHTHKHRL